MVITHRKLFLYLQTIILSITLSCYVFPVAADDSPDLRCPDHKIARCGKAREVIRRIEAGKDVAEWKREYETMLKAGMREAITATDVLHVDLEIEITSFVARTLRGSCTSTIESRMNGLTQFTFRLREQYIITNATIGGTPVTVTGLSTTTRQVTLDRVYDIGETFDLTIDYQGIAEDLGMGSIEFDTHAGEDIVSTLSQPYYAYTWWPAKDGDYAEAGDMSDKFTLDFAIIAPDTMTTASNGKLVAIDTLSGNRYRYRWSSKYPIATYLVSFSTTNYSTSQRFYTPIKGGNMPVLLYLYPEDDTTANRNALYECIDMMYTLRDYYGEYPFVDEKYGIYEFEFGGGMEHQTFSGQGSFGEYLTVHELAHQWWGDMVTCKTWNHIWLNEGFASYSEALWEEFKPGSSGHPALKSYMTTMKYYSSGTIYVPDTEMDSVYEILNPHTSYDKAAWVVHMLRHVMGDTNFFNALAAYRADYEFGAATTEDFRAVCERYYSGGDLYWFFQEWIYGEYVPAYNWGWDTVTVNGMHYLLIWVDQIQGVTVQRFTMPIDIVADGYTNVIFNDADEEYFVIPVSSVPSSVSFDPDEWILWGLVSERGYKKGPPTIVETDPIPGAVLDVKPDIDTITITFHTNVDTDATHFSLVGDVCGPQSFTITDTTKVNPVILNLDAPLKPDKYTLTVTDDLIANDSKLALDGETTDPASILSLPTGDGEPGGNAVITFTVAAPPIPLVPGFYVLLTLGIVTGSVIMYRRYV